VTEFLFVEERPTEGREHRVTSAISIGRHECDVVVEDPEVSRRHLQLRVAGASIAVEDLGSTHGTFVNGTQIEGIRELSPGDSVEFGATVWRLQPMMPDRPPVADPATEPQPAPPPPLAEPAPAAPAQPAAAPAPPAAERPARSEPPPQRQFAPSAAPAPAAAPPAAAEPSGAFQEPRTRRGRSAARSLPATVYSYGVVGVTAAALIVYFAAR
jgi:Inner membrane component of T3SS, cytoplasmic domain